MTPVKLGLLGLGTVGRGVVQLIEENQQSIIGRTGRPVEVSCAAVRDLDKAKSDGYGSLRLSTDYRSVCQDPEVDIVLELMGGTSLAREAVLMALSAGKHVVTANKALIATHGNELFAAAAEHGVSVGFESSVAGGIPVIKALREGLAANQVQWLAGIINGTSNFILSEMASKGREFDSILKEAQALGYAEADPSFDIEGVDAAHKLTILASLAFGVPMNFEATYVEGISQLSSEDVAYAKELGYTIKHLGFARQSEQGIEVRVHPTLIPSNRLIANVNGVMNAVVVYGNAVGPTLYYGAGAGGLATGSAVVADVIDAVRTLESDNTQRVPPLAFTAEAIQAQTVLPAEAFNAAYYLRVSVDDRPGVMASITRVLGEQDISIEAIIQKEPSEPGTQATVIMLTRQVPEQQMNAAISDINALSSVHGEVVRIRVESLG